MSGRRRPCGLLDAAMFLLLGLSIGPAAAQPPDPPAIAPLWSVSSDHCLSVHADGEPWSQCGFQSLDMNADASRVLTATVYGLVQLWDGEGRELRRFDWEPTRPRGGLPSAWVAIAGGVGVAVVHYNQLLLIDLADGREIARRVLDVDSVRGLRAMGNRMLAEVYRRRSRMGTAEIDLGTGALTDLGELSLLRAGPGYWVTGEGRAVVLHRVGALDLPLERPCMPIDARYCIWMDRPGRTVHLLEVRSGRWSRLDYAREFEPFTQIFVVPAGDRVLAVSCWRVLTESRDECDVRDFTSGAELFRFESREAVAPRFFGGVDEQGRPELRASRRSGQEQVRIALDGAERIVDRQGRAALLAPGGGMILPGPAPGSGVLVDVAGRPLATLPFPPTICGSGPSYLLYGCRLSADGRRWLVPTATRLGEGESNRVGVALYELPAR